MNNKIYLAFCLLMILSSSLFGQTISRTTASSISGTACPGIGIEYQVTKPSVACAIT